MRRLDIINAVNKVYNAFNESKIVTHLFTGNVEKNDPTSMMEAYMDFIKHYEKFGDAEKTILKIFDLEGVESNALWARILTGDIKESRDITRGYFRAITLILDYLPGVVELLRQDNLEYTSKNHGNTSVFSNIPEKELISIVLPETDSTSSNPERLIMALQSIELFYTTAALISGKNNNDLSVVAIDSGSDKSFDFLGNAKVIATVKEFILEIWDRIVFHREKKMDYKIDLIGKSLPVIEKIKELEDSGAMGPEQAEILRRNIFTGTKNFISAGAILPEFNTNNTYDPKRLMAPEPKLLTIPSSQSEEIESFEVENKISSHDENLATLSEEEKELLKKLLLKNRENVMDEKIEKTKGRPRKKE